MTLRRLKWIAVSAALAFILLLEAVRQLLYSYLLTWPGRIVTDAVVLSGAMFFLGAMFHVIERMQRRLERQNRELLALHSAALDVYGDLALDKVLQTVVDQASLLLDARYGALSVVDDDNRIESFVTAGISPEERARIGPPPVGHGLLGVVLREGQRLRTPDICRDPRSHGFPPHHPAMHSLLAVPVLCRGPFRGNLYLAEKREAPEFTAEDEETLVRFATTAAIAIDNAYLHQRLSTLAVAEERLRIAHEMHDGLAQVLAYVNTKAQAVREFLKKGREEDATRHLDQLAAAAREVYGDVRESIIGLRNAAVPGRSTVEALTDYAESWGAQHQISCRVSVEGDVRLEANAETQLQIQRIVQEALTNVRKHAHAGRVDVTLRQEGDRLTVTVQDDGSGFHPDALGRAEMPRFGLSTMRERARSLGGDLRIDSEPGAGTRVVLELSSPSSPSSSSSSSTLRSEVTR
jgi:signal transduction histidine kinase